MQFYCENQSYQDYNQFGHRQDKKLVVRIFFCRASYFINPTGSETNKLVFYSGLPWFDRIQRDLISRKITKILRNSKEFYKNRQKRPSKLRPPKGRHFQEKILSKGTIFHNVFHAFTDITKFRIEVQRDAPSIS